MSKLPTYTATTLMASFIGTFSMTAAAAEQDSFIEALTGGKVSFSARARYESVEQDNDLKDADAFTVRSTLGYETGRLNGFGAFLEFENVTDLGGDNYNSTTNGETEYSVVADPDGTEVNQAYLSYQGFDTVAKFGRQQITYRDAPFHRYIGNVLWRQNHQTFDAFSIQNTSLPDTRLSYAFVNKINTIFGDDRDAGIIRNGVIDVEAHLLNAQYSGLPFGKHWVCDSVVLLRSMMPGIWFIQPNMPVKVIIKAAPWMLRIIIWQSWVPSIKAGWPNSLMKCRKAMERTVLKHPWALIMRFRAGPINS